MPSLRELRRKIKSVRSTEQITKAMKMVAAARLRRGEARILSARPFAVKMEELLSDMMAQVMKNEEGLPTDEVWRHPLLQKKPQGTKGILLITADKGLCGSFNSSLIKKALDALQDCEQNGQKPVVFCVGKKGRDFFKRTDVRLAGEYLNVFKPVSYAHAELIGQDVMRFFLSEKAQDVTMIYNEFKSVVQQTLIQKTLLPLTPPAMKRSSPAVQTGYIYEPAREKLLDALFPRYLKAQVFRALLESYAAEMGARMSAMENASKNARELIEDMTLTSNKIRQTAITKEISELVGGAEALN